MVRYADDLLILCRTKADAEEALQLLKATLGRLDLELHQDKTRIVDLTDGRDGFDFLGFTHRRTPSWRNPRPVLHRWPSRRAQTAIRDKVRDITTAGTSRDLELVIRQLRPVLQGWGAYFRWGYSYRVFGHIDQYVITRLVLFMRRKYHWAGRRWGAGARDGGVAPLLQRAGVPRLTGTVKPVGGPATATR